MLDVNYSNGFDMNRVITPMLGRLAWRQLTGDNVPALSDANKTSKSGRFFDDAHALSNIVNVRTTMPDPAATSDTFNTFLEQLYKGVILRALSGVFNAPEYFEQKTVYNRFSPSINQTIDNSGKFVGYVIDVAPDNTVAIQIESATLLFTKDVTIEMHLYADGDNDPLACYEVTAQANIPTIVEFENLVFGYKTKLSNARRYYFGYYQDDIIEDDAETKAIAELADYNTALMFNARPVSLEVVDETVSFDTVYRYTIPFGFNLEMSSFRDHTDIIVRKAHLFDEVIGLQMAAQVIENIMFSTRSNATERLLKDGIDKMMVYMELKGTVPISDAPSTTGISKEIERELVRLKESFLPKAKAQIVSLCS